MLQGVIRIKKKGDGIKGLNRCFMVFRYARVVLQENASSNTLGIVAQK
jgi:hypothetical protein